MSLYGRQGRIIAKNGQREALAAILLANTKAAEMPGCRLYLVGASETDGDALLVSEVWESADMHKASLSIPAVRDTIAKAMPLIARVEGEAMLVLAGAPEGGGQ